MYFLLLSSPKQTVPVCMRDSLTESECVWILKTEQKRNPMNDRGKDKTFCV